MQLTITIPDDKAVTFRDNFCLGENYPVEIPDADGYPIPNPETKAAFMRRTVKEYMIRKAKQGQMQRAVTDAEAAAIADTSLDGTVDIA